MTQIMRDRTLALGAMFQCLHSVNEIARTGRCAEARLATAVDSILRRDAPTTLAVYGELADLRDGLIVLAQLLSGPTSPNDRALMRYGVAIMHLARKLLRRKDLLQRLDQGIDAAERGVEHFGRVHENVFAGLASTWSDTVATMSPRIMVAGEQRHLEDSNAVARIRTLLLAAVRSAVLWQQKGGNRWNLILRRRKMAETALELIGASAPPQRHGPDQSD